MGLRSSNCIILHIFLYYMYCTYIENCNTLQLCTRSIINAFIKIIFLWEKALFFCRENHILVLGDHLRGNPYKLGFHIGQSLVSVTKTIQNSDFGQEWFQHMLIAIYRKKRQFHLWPLFGPAGSRPVFQYGGLNG